MKSTLHKFPETILVDATYKVINLDMPLYTTLAIDGNNASQVIGFFLVFFPSQQSVATKYRSNRSDNIRL